MFRGIKLKANPNKKQIGILNQWMGCVRYIWNAKTGEEKEQRLILNSKKTKKYPDINQTYSHLKDKQESPWLFDCPSVLLRNSISNWYATYRNFFKKRCGRPRFKKRDGRGSIYLTRDLFNFSKCPDGVTRLFIGNKKHNIGYLSIHNHAKYKVPNSIYIKRKHNQYWVSFCYDDGRELEEKAQSDKKKLKSLSKISQKKLLSQVVGIDRGVARPVQCSYDESFFDLGTNEKKRKAYMEARRMRYQKRLSRQQKGSNRRYKTKERLSRKHERVANIRDNFCHQVSRKLVDRAQTQVIVFENLGTKKMTKKPKSKQDANGKWLPNRRRAKAGLNRSILDKNWYRLELYTKYKAASCGKTVFKVAPNYTSQECAHCHHIHPDNRKGQSKFLCVKCGHTDNADVNAAKVIQWRAIQLIRNPGTGLSKGGLLSPGDTGRGADVRRGKNTSSTHAVVEKRQKRNSHLAVEALVL